MGEEEEELEVEVEHSNEQTLINSIRLLTL
jgi:hypothetical protein